ncbi:MAG: glycosyltransferase family 4 protein [bacterium]|nr:glycosyltransferase family 4 protein [bacterium]
MTDESKKKVLYVITKSVWAGASKYTHDLATALPNREYSPMVAAGGKGAMAEKIIAAGIPYFEIKAFQRDVSFFKDIRAFFEILSLLFKTKPDVVHVSSAKAGGIAGAAVFTYKVLKKLIKPFRRISRYDRSQETALSISCPKTVFTAHGWTFNERRPRWQIALIKFFSRLTCLFYDKIICVSEYDCNIALKNKIAPARKMVVIHNGIKPEEYDFLPREEARHKLGDSISKLEIESPSEVLVGTIGELTKNKGHKLLIESIKSQFLSSNFKFLIIGFDGGEKKNLESQIVSAGLGDKVFLVEGLPDAAKYLKAFDIFVLSSLKEGLPYVLLEAGLAELPIAASKVGGIPEIIENGKNGILINPASADEFARAIKKLADNSETHAKLAAAARQKILQDFSFEKMLGATINLYKSR